jgi:hypothetical protein
LEPKHHARIRRWMGAACALALVCGWSSSRLALGQTSAGDSSTTVKPKAHAKTAKKSSKATSSSAKAHTGSHPAASAHSKSSTSVSRSSKSKYASTRKNGKRKTTARGQQKIDPERAQAIQEALIREHYLNGEAAGKWDQASEDAMRRYQADHGWQAKTVPDSRALISLGLGPSHDHLLNPESAMTTGPFPTRSSSPTPVSNSADPGARVNTTPAVSPTPAAPPAHDSSIPQ